MIIKKEQNKCIDCGKHLKSNKGKRCQKCYGYSKLGKSTWNKGLKGVCKPNSGSFKNGVRVSPKTEFKKGENLGENHPMWKGGITPLVRRVRTCFEYRQWRSDIYTRDNYTCQLCGARSGNGKKIILHADHNPKLFSEIMKEYNIKTMEDAQHCEELWSINNGRTLCDNCHLKYGRRK